MSISLNLVVALDFEGCLKYMFHVGEFIRPKQDTIFVYSPAIHNGCCILSINLFCNRNIFLFAHNIGVLEELIDILTDLYKINFQERYHNLLRKRTHSVRQSRTDVTTLKTFFDSQFVTYVFSRHKYPTDEFEILVYRV